MITKFIVWGKKINPPRFWFLAIPSGSSGFFRFRWAGDKNPLINLALCRKDYHLAKYGRMALAFFQRVI